MRKSSRNSAKHCHIQPSATITSAKTQQQQKKMHNATCNMNSLFQCNVRLCCKNQTDQKGQNPTYSTQRCFLSLEGAEMARHIHDKVGATESQCLEFDHVYMLGILGHEGTNRRHTLDDTRGHIQVWSPFHALEVPPSKSHTRHSSWMKRSLLKANKLSLQKIKFNIEISFRLLQINKKKGGPMRTYGKAKLSVNSRNSVQLICVINRIFGKSVKKIAQDVGKFWRTQEL
jgi:hypothetical protein